MTIEIEKNIPLPSVIFGRKDRYPLKHMRVGDSIFIKFDADISPRYFRAKLSSLIGQWAKRHNVKFTMRTIDGGVRVWRVE